jgi:hypothetical protein
VETTHCHCESCRSQTSSPVATFVTVHNSALRVTRGQPNEYVSSPDVPPIVGRDEERSVMHESTHAFFDLQSIDILAAEEEAICYVVGGLYERMTGLPQWRWGTQPTCSRGCDKPDLLFTQSGYNPLVERKGRPL